MHKVDMTLKILVSHKDVFADIFNVLFFDGEEMVLPCDLEDAAPVSSYKADGEVKSQERDVTKYWKKGKMIFKLGIENQRKKDNDMPLRIISYDGADYRNQIEKPGPRYPVVTFVLYCGKGEWKSPLCLYDVLQLTENAKKFVSDYRINVFSVGQFTQSQLGKFKADFQIIADFLACRNQNIEYTGSKKKIDHETDVLNCIEALDGDKRIVTEYNELKESKEGGANSNMGEVIDRVIKRGREEGSLNAKIATATKMIQKEKFSFEDIAECTGLSLEKVKALAEEISVAVHK